MPICSLAIQKDGFAPRTFYKGALAWYGKLTWESVHAWNLIILCLLIVWGMTFILMVHLRFYAIPLLFYDVMYHTGQCKRTGGCYNELVVAFFSTGGGVKGKKIYTC